MISNFLMCLGYVPNDGKEAVNVMILECVMLHFFSECLALQRGISQPVCYKHGKIFSHWRIIHFSVTEATEIRKLHHSEQTIIHSPARA